MKYIIPLLLLIFGLVSYADDELWCKFYEPAKEERTKVWWFHGETETTEEGIDADLEAFRDAGIGGVVFYDQVHGSAEGAFDSMSPVIRCDLGEEVGERLEFFGILPDVAINYKDKGTRIRMANTTEDRVCFFHRQTPKIDIYFLYNHSSQPFEEPMTFRSIYSCAERWNPDSGTRMSIPMDANKTIQISLKPYEGTFIVIQ